MKNPYGYKPIKLERYHVTYAGDRTLTPAQKEKAKADVGYKCQECGRKFDSQFLQVHHIKEVGASKKNFSLPVYSLGKKYIPEYDRRKSNLRVLCIICHNKTKKKKKTSSSNPLDFLSQPKKATRTTKTKQFNPYGDFNISDLI